MYRISLVIGFSLLLFMAGCASEQQRQPEETQQQMERAQPDTLSGASPDTMSTAGADTTAMESP